MKKIKRAMIVFVLLMTLILFAACDGEAYIFRYSDENYDYEDIEIIVSKNLAYTLENYAAKDADGYNWTLPSYFDAAAKNINAELNFSESGLGYSYYDSFVSEDDNWLMYYIIGKFPKNWNVSNYLSGVKDYENLFMGSVTQRYGNILDGACEQLENKTNGHKAIEAINGVGSFPSVFEAFPQLKNYSVSAFKVIQFISGYRKSTSENGDAAEFMTVFGTGEEINDYFVPFETTLGGANSNPLQFTTKYYVSVGWFLAAILGGLITVWVLFMFVKVKNKSKAVLGEKQSEEESDIDAPIHLLRENQKIETNGGLPMYQGSHPYIGNQGGYGNYSQGGYNQGGYNQGANTYNNNSGIDPFDGYANKPQTEANKLQSLDKPGVETSDPFEQFRRAATHTDSINQSNIEQKIDDDFNQKKD